MTRKKQPSRLAGDLIDTAEGMHRIGLLHRAAYDKITLSHLGWKAAPGYFRLLKYEQSAPVLG